jgi:ribonuclease Z
MVLAGVSASKVSQIFITHFHGDHCLGLPGLLQRMSLEKPGKAVEVFFPSSGLPYFERLRHAAVFEERIEVHPRAISPPFPGEAAGPMRVVGRSLDHGVETIGWRLEEPDGRRMLPGRLAEAGIEGPDVGRLQRAGMLRVGRRTVSVEQMSERRAGQSFAFVMDTRLCDAAFELAAGADLLVCEATFLSTEESLAKHYGHLTAAQAGRIAAEAGARRLVLTHFSQRHEDERAYLEEAGEVFGDVVAARDLEVVSFPGRR